MIDQRLKDWLRLEALDGNTSKLYEAISHGKNSLAFSLSRAHKAHVSSMLDKFVLYVCPSVMDVGKTLSYFQSYLGDRVAVLRGNDDVLVHRKANGNVNTGTRCRTLKKIMEGKLDCCIVSAQELMQYYAKPSRLFKAFVNLKVGDSIDLTEFTDQLVAIGYSREETVEEKNTFCVKGDLVSVYCGDKDLPVRISFFGDEVETIKTFDPESLITVGELREISVAPINDYIWSKDMVAEGVKQARKDIDRLSGDAYYRASEIVDGFAFKSSFGAETQWILPYLTQYVSSIFDFLPTNSVVVLDEPSLIEEQMKLYEQEHIARVKSLVEEGSVTKRHVNSILDLTTVKQNLDLATKLGFCNLQSSNPLFSPEETFVIKTSNLGNYHIHYQSLFDDLRSFCRNQMRVVICCKDERQATAMFNALKEEEIYCQYAVDKPFGQGISVAVEDLSYGFVYPSAKLAVIGSEDLAKSRRAEERKIVAKKSAFTMPQVGDYVVHEVHGIGKCLGIRRVKTGSIEQDYVTVQYKNDGLLYVPVDQMDRLSRYSGAEGTPRLSAIGGKDFAKVKENVKKSVKAMAIDLLELYSKRQQKIGYKYPQDTIWQREFEDSFEFKETPDQLQAVLDAKSDMERGVVMDRLLCGDVGYGKTEVALRIIFKTIMENKQAVILAPTTILAQQHYNTATARFNDFKIKVELLTRFQTSEQIKRSLDNLATGKSLVAVATHRILSSDVHFKDLGLLVLDEEQRFGVEHKEKLKTLKNNVNVLTLSATPIPRTLNMAMSGIRDMSVLTVPPANRLPVQTTVTELTNGLLKDAISREISRGGQVYVLFNRVSGIEEFAERVRQLVPEAKLVVGHGQMNSAQLEDSVNKFYNGEANVFVCTTIIENGIDVPLANTLIVCDADKLGLAQLYQLRGRVGRSNRIAYAYFTVRAGKVLTSDSYKRLNAIMDYTEFGSGFKIAMRDLEIRGAGNLLGKEQSGHIQKIGYDLYCKLLRESIADLNGEDIEDDYDPQLSLAVDAYVPSEYVSSENARLRIYRQVSELSSEVDRDNLLQSLQESFGEAPQCIVNLLDIGLIKNLAKESEVQKITLTDVGAGITFRSVNIYRNPKIIGAVSELGDSGLLTNDATPTLVFDCRYLSNLQKLAMVKQFLLNSVKSF